MPPFSKMMIVVYGKLALTPTKVVVIPMLKPCLVLLKLATRTLCVAACEIEVIIEEQTIPKYVV